ncbi:hypothetical protein GF377_08550 [candidate division GN15 bacterium]|nr:hypothetical protein [candidate division GN15 bacterium]
MPDPTYPPLPLVEWRDTKTTLHLFTQIVGKVRLACHPKLNHWWHAPFYLSARGLTTGSMPSDYKLFEMEFDLIAHELTCKVSDGRIRSVPLKGKSVADFYADVCTMLSDLGIPSSILAKPFDPSRAGSDIPFDQDHEHKAYDAEYVERFFRIMCGIEPIFRDFRGRFLGKCSPVHLFWHSFDLACTRFSGKAVPVADGADPVTAEAYSHEVISGGFWVGDDNLPEPAFYTYVYPEPDGLANEPLKPDHAWWQENEGSHMALLRYEDFRHADDPRRALLDFLQSAYDAGAKLAGWPRELDVRW